MRATVFIPILVGADSRSSNMEDGEGTPIYAYVDSTQKIFRYRKIFFQIGGTYDYSHYTIYGLFDKFQKFNQKKVNVRSFYPTFCKYAQTIMTDSEYNIFRNGLECIVSGYNNLRPCAYFYRRSHIDSITGEGFISNLRENAHIRQIGGLKNITNIDIVSMVKLVKQIINIEANSYKNGISPIGGPPSVAYITKEGKIYEDFQKGNSYKTVLEAMTAAFNDKSHRIYRSPQDSVIYKNSIKHFYLH